MIEEGQQCRRPDLCSVRSDPRDPMRCSRSARAEAPCGTRRWLELRAEEMPELRAKAPCSMWEEVVVAPARALRGGPLRLPPLAVVRALGRPPVAAARVLCRVGSAPAARGLCSGAAPASRASRAGAAPGGLCAGLPRPAARVSSRSPAAAAWALRWLASSGCRAGLLALEGESLG